MYILPRRFFVMKDKLFVSFNLSNIPRDMKITSVELHLPFRSSTVPANVYIKEITSRWNENGIKIGRFPTLSKIRRVLKCYPRQKELVANITLLGKKWYTKHAYNYGIFIKVENKNIKYLENDPPFLIIDTI